MTERNWGFVSTGDTFERLVADLVSCHDPRSIGFTRPGRDYAQDVLSGDGKTVYQAKYHKSETTKKPISDALSELEQIKKYLDPSHKHYDKWKDIERWVLVTNIQGHPTTTVEWDKQVVPAFKEEGIDVELWTRERLDQMLNQNPHVERVFFEGKPHVFWTLGQARREALVNEVAQDSFFINEMIGRETELETIARFLNDDQQVLLIHGPGGVGKSRLLFEACERAREQWQVFWLNETAFGGESSLYVGMVPDQPTLVVLDEPTKTETIELLVREMVIGSRASDWKLLIAARSGKMQIDQLIKRRGANFVADAIELKPLSTDSSFEFANQLMKQADLAILDKERFDSFIMGPTGGHPMWLTIAVTLIKQGTSLIELPSDRYGLATLYISETLDQHPHVLQVLRWLALVQPLNIGDEHKYVRSAIAARIGINEDDFDVVLTHLVESRLVRLRGRHSTPVLEVSPDVIRDAVLREWLTKPRLGDALRRMATGDAAKILEHALDDNGMPFDQILDAYVRIEAICEAEQSQLDPSSSTSLEGSRDVDLLGVIVSLLRDAAQLDTYSQFIVIERLEQFYYQRPVDAFEILKLLHETELDPQTRDVLIWGDTTYTHSELLDLLPGALKKLSRYAPPELRKEIVQFFAVLAREDLGPVNQGKKARELLPQLISNDDAWAPDYAVEGLQLILDELAQIVHRPLETDEQGYLMGLLKAQLRVERTRHRMRSNKLILERYILPRDLEWPEFRAFHAILEQLKTLLQDNIDVSNRKFVWRALCLAASEANRVSSRNDGGWKAQVIELLKFTRDYVEDKNKTLTLGEFVEARQIWDWHVNHGDPQTQTTAIANECEQLYQSHDAIVELEHLFGKFRADDWKAQEAKEVEFVRILAKGSSHEIDKFVDRCVDYLGVENMSRALGIAWVLGKEFDVDAEPLQSYVAAILQKPKQGHTVFVCGILAAHIEALGTSGSAQASAARRWFDAIGDEESRRAFAWQLFGGDRVPSYEEAFVFEELLKAGLFNEQHSVMAWLIIGNFLTHTTDVLETLFNLLIERTRLGALTSCYSKVLQSNPFARKEVPQETLSWLLRKIITTTPDLGSYQGNDEYYINLLRKSVVLFPTETYRTFLDARIELREQAEEDSRPRIYVLPFHNGPQLSSFVETVSESDDNLVKMFEELLDLFESRGVILPSSLCKDLVALDPNGVVLPPLVCRRIANVNNLDELLRFAQFGQRYGVNSEVWKRIALAVLNRSNLMRVNRQDLEKLDQKLLIPDVEFIIEWSDGFDSKYRELIDRAENALNQTTDPVLRQFWEREYERTRTVHDQKLAGWLSKIYSLVEEENDDEAVDLLFDEIDGLLANKKFEICNSLLEKINPHELNVNLNVSLLAITIDAHSCLPYRANLVKIIREIFEKQEPSQVNALLKGLE